jgi:hypothetical protein
MTTVQIVMKTPPIMATSLISFYSTSLLYRSEVCYLFINYDILRVSKINDALCII